MTHRHEETRLVFFGKLLSMYFKDTTFLLYIRSESGVALTWVHVILLVQNFLGKMRLAEIHFLSMDDTIFCGMGDILDGELPGLPPDR